MEQKSSEGTQHAKYYDNYVGAIAGSFLIAIIIGCIVIVCKVVGELEESDHKVNRSNLPQSSDQSEHPSSESTGRRNQLSLRPSAIGQAWIESGILLVIDSILPNSVMVQRYFKGLLKA